MSNPVESQRLERRLEYGGADFLALDATLAELSMRQRDVGTLITPEDGLKVPLILLRATDVSRTAIYGPIRSLNLRIAIRINSKTAAYTPDSFDALIAAAENHFAINNLTTSLDAPTRGCRVMMARRAGSWELTQSSFIRTQAATLEVRCVRSEETTEGLPGSTADGVLVDGDGSILVDGDGTQLVF